MFLRIHQSIRHIARDTTLHSKQENGENEKNVISYTQKKKKINKSSNSATNTPIILDINNFVSVFRERAPPSMSYLLGSFRSNNLLWSIIQRFKMVVGSHFVRIMRMRKVKNREMTTKNPIDFITSSFSPFASLFPIRLCAFFTFHAGFE